MNGRGFSSSLAANEWTKTYTFVPQRLTQRKHVIFELKKSTKLLDYRKIRIDDCRIESTAPLPSGLSG
jgi:hypothetical protein